MEANGNIFVGHQFPFGGGARATKLVWGDPAATLTCSPAVLNSTGAASRIRAVDSNVVAAGNVTLVADRLPANQFVLFLNSRMGGPTPNRGGSLGTLRLGGSIGRFVGRGQIRPSDETGLASLPLDLAALPNGSGSVAVLPGDTLHFQAWHPDVAACQATSNLKGAVEVVFY